MTECLACGRPGLEPVVDLGGSPTMTGSLWDDADAARRAVRGPMRLAACGACGHVQNEAFDESLVEYDVGYDNNLHHSPTFRRFADDLARRLVEERGVRGKRVVEIGSGKGDLLESVCRLGGNTGTGYDPTVEPDTEIPGVTLIADYFHPGEAVEPYDLLVCRHVLEHLADPATLLRSLRAAAPERSLHYLEVPSAEFNFGPDGMWDCIYPHVSYFSRQSLRTLVQRCGFEVVVEGTAFDGQFLWVEARPGPVVEDVPAGVDNHLERVEAFRDRWSGTVARWRERIGEQVADGRTVVLWGAGAKGVTFLNAVDPEARLAVVDLNPNKWQRHLPGTGHRVVAPEALTGLDVGTVLITNPVYRTEIQQQLQDMGVHADVTSV